MPGGQRLRDSRQSSLHGPYTAVSPCEGPCLVDEEVQAMNEELQDQPGGSSLRSPEPTFLCSMTCQNATGRTMRPQPLSTSGLSGSWLQDKHSEKHLGIGTAMDGHGRVAQPPPHDKPQCRARCCLHGLVILMLLAQCLHLIIGLCMRCDGCEAGFFRPTFDETRDRSSRNATSSS